MLNLLDKARRLNSIKSKNYSFNANYSSNKTSNNSKANTSNLNNKAYKNNNSYNNNIKIALNTSNNYKSKSSNKTSKLVYSNYKKLEYLEASCYLKYPHLSSRNKKTINNTKVSNRKETVLATNSYNNKSITIDFILDSGATIYTCYIKELFNSITSTDSYIK